MNEDIMRQVMNEVDKASKDGNGPFAAFLVDKNGNVLFKEHNKTRTNMDPTAHAEILLIRKVCKKLNTRDLSDYVIYTNAEPCSMCISAMVKANIKKLVYGCNTEDNNNPYLRVKDVLEKCSYKFEVISGILNEECKKQIYNVRNK